MSNLYQRPIAQISSSSYQVYKSSSEIIYDNTDAHICSESDILIAMIMLFNQYRNGILKWIYGGRISKLQEYINIFFNHCKSSLKSILQFCVADKSISFIAVANFGCYIQEVLVCFGYTEDMRKQKTMSTQVEHKRCSNILEFEIFGIRTQSKPAPPSW